MTATSKMTFWKNPSLSNKLVSAIIDASKNYLPNALNTYVAENLQFIMQSTFPGVLTGESCIGGVGTIFQAWSKIWIHDSIYHCFDHHSECSSFQLINLKRYNLHNLCLPEDWLEVYENRADRLSNHLRLNEISILTFFQFYFKINRNQLEIVVKATYGLHSNKYL